MRSYPKSLRLPYVIGGALLLAALVFSIQYDVYRGFSLLRLKAAEQKQIGETINVLSSVRAAFVDMENSVGGFILTGNESLLDPLESGERSYVLAISAAEKKMQDDVQRTLLQKIKSLVERWQREHAQPLIAQRRDARTSATVSATQTASTNMQGRAIVEEVLRTIKEIVDQDARLSIIKNSELVTLQERIESELARLAGAVLFVVFLLSAMVLRTFGTADERTRALQKEVVTRRVAEQHAIDGELRNEALIESLAEGVAITDNLGRIVYSNRRLAEMFGYAAGGLDGKDLYLLLAPDDRAHILGLLSLRNNPQQASGRVSLETVGKHLSGNTFPAEISFSQYATDQGLFVAAVIRDISRRQQAESHLRQALSLQQAIFDSADYAIISTGLDGKILTLNRTAEILTGLSDAPRNGYLSNIFVRDWVRQRVARLAAEGDSVLPSAMDVLTIPASRGQPDDSEAELLHTSGTAHPVFLSITVLKDENQHQIGFLAIAKDLTQRREVERMKSEFVATVSHELRTPLAAILGALALLDAGDVGDVPEPLKEFVSMAYENSVRLSKLVDDILDLSKIESGRVTHQPVEFLVERFVEDACSLHGGYAHKFGVALEVVLPIPVATLYLDRHRLMQVLTNLIANAIKFSPKGGAVKLAVTSTVGWIRIAVKDDGPGIAESFWPRIFEKFAQGDASDTRQNTGTGLGLAISRALVDAMGGRIDFVRKPPPGSEFFIELPLSYQSRSPESTGQFPRVG